MEIQTQARHARAVLSRTTHLSVRTAGGCGAVERYGVEADGSVVLVAPEDSDLVAEVRRAGDDLPVVVDAPDLCPEAGHLRGVVRLGGWVAFAGWVTFAGLRRGGALLRVEVAEVILAGPDDASAVEIDLDAYTAG